MDPAGYAAAQTAQIVGAPRGTVLARVHRGRECWRARQLRSGKDAGDETRGGS